jgi:hypothetical protein
MAAMSKKQQKLSEEEIDDLVVGHANDDSAWGKPVHVKRPLTESFSLPTGLATRAAFLAKLHRSQIDEWLNEIIKERVELEEASFAEVKRLLAQSDKAALNVKASYKESPQGKKHNKD